MRTSERSLPGSRARPRANSVDAPACGDRLAYLDNLKLLLVAVIIAGHGAVAYGDLESAWPYQDIQEVRLGAATNVALSAVVIPAAMFAMGLFFLISGLLTPGSVARKGPRTFARDRLVRLGAPLLVWTLVLWPGSIWAAHVAAGDRSSFWAQLTHAEPALDAGPMWFVEVLLAYSLAYAVWRSWRGRAATTDGSSGPERGCALTGRTLVALGAAISMATVLVRLAFPAASGQIGQSHLWQWPQFVAMFGFGVVAANRGWLAPMPHRIRRRCGFAALAGVVAFGALGTTMAAAGIDGGVLFEHRLHWAPLTLAAIEGPLAVGASLWLLGLAQRHLDRRTGPRCRALARGAYAAFLVQGAVLLGLMIALRPVAMPAEAKALVAATAGVTGSFGLARLLVTRTPLRRIL